MFHVLFGAELERRADDDASAQALDRLAAKAKASFNAKFWFTTPENAAARGGNGGTRQDVVEGDPHGTAIRPNMLFAVTVGGDLLDAARRKSVVQAAARDLLTRMAPRTLLEEDQAYQQGTV